ncbi:MAG: glycosyltransferase family 2 protein [Cyanobacteria bacterium J06648_16]
MPKVSIIIPAFNAMKYLPATLENVAQQTFQDYEIIIVDDGSRDSIKEWAAQIDDKRIRFFSQANAGSAAARNTGITHASGDFIAFLDADDLWDPTKLAKQVRTLEEDPQAGLVYCWVATIDANGHPQGKIYRNSAEGDVWTSLIEHDLTECGSNPMVRRNCFDRVGKFDSNFAYAQTWEMWLRIADVFPFRVIEEPLVYYRFHSSNISKQWQTMEASFTAIIEKVFATAPAKRQVYKSRSYASAYLCIAWKALQNLGGDYQTAQYFQKKALTYYPKARFSGQNIRLKVAIALVRIFGLDGYSQLRLKLHQLKYQLTRLPKIAA